MPVTVRAEQLREGDLYLPGLAVRVKGLLEGLADARVPGPPGKGGSEGIRVGEPRRDDPAAMGMPAGVKPVDAAAAPARVELCGVFQVGDAAHASLLRHPALVPDVPVPAALIGRHDDPRRFRRGALRRH